MFLVTLVGGNARRYVGVKVDTRINVSVSVAIYSAAVPNRGGEFPQGGEFGCSRREILVRLEIFKNLELH